MRASAAILLAASWLSPSYAAGAPSVSIGYAAEDYSFANSGALRTVEGRAPFGAWTAMARADSLRRFGQSDQEGAAGVAWKGEGQGASLWLGGTPAADILPRAYAEAAYDRALRRGLYLEAAARVSDYVPAKVYGGSLAVFWQVLPTLELTGRVGQTQTRFRAAGDKSYPGFLAKAKLGSSEGRAWTGVSYGSYKEAFEAGAPGGTGAFSAGVYGLEAGARLLPGLTMRAGFEYEDRDNGTFVRRWTLGAGWDF